jgi:hypothetical protein
MVTDTVDACIENVHTWLSISQDYWTQRHQIWWCSLHSQKIICSWTGAFFLDQLHIICCRLCGKISDYFSLQSISTRYGCNLQVPIINVSKYQKGVRCTGMKLFGDHCPAISSLNHSMNLFKPAIKTGSLVSLLLCKRMYWNQIFMIINT